MAGCFGPRLFGYQNWASSTGANAPVRRNDLTSGRVVESDDFGCASMRYLRLRVEQMPIPKEEFSAWFEWARGRFAEAGSYPLINEKVYNTHLFSDAYDPGTDNDAIREHLESRLAHAQDDLATRFVILNYYYRLLHFDPDLKEEYVAHLRSQFRRDLAFFVRLRPVEKCAGLNDISWEITNSCAVRDWTRAQALYLRLRSLEEIPLGTFHAAYGHFLFRATFDDYDPENAEDDNETLSMWSVLIVDRKPESYLEDWNFEISTLGLGIDERFSLPKGRSDEFLRDAKNELEKARDRLTEFRPGLRSALARCYMARGEYRQAASEYKELADVWLDQIAWTGRQMPDLLRPQVRARVAAALDLAQDDSELRRFLEHWIRLKPDELGPREHLAKLEAKCGNYEAAFRYLSEAHSINPAHDQDWKATLLVELGTRAGGEERVVEIVRKNIERNPELRVIMEGIVGDYWTTFLLLTPEAKDSFRVATRLLFDSTIGESAWIHAAMAAGKSVELQLRTTVFESFAVVARPTAAPPDHANAQGTRRDPLVEFIERGSKSKLTLGQMVNSLLGMVNPKDVVGRSFRDWLKSHRPKLYGALTYGKLNENDSIAVLRNLATHESITKEDAVNYYKTCRRWLDELTRDR